MGHPGKVFTFFTTPPASGFRRLAPADSQSQEVPHLPQRLSSPALLPGVVQGQLNVVRRGTHAGLALRPSLQGSPPYPPDQPCPIPGNRPSAALQGVPGVLLMGRPSSSDSRSIHPPQKCRFQLGHLWKTPSGASRKNADFKAGSSTRKCTSPLNQPVRHAGSCRGPASYDPATAFTRCNALRLTQNAVHPNDITGHKCPWLLKRGCAGEPAFRGGVRVAPGAETPRG